MKRENALQIIGITIAVLVVLGIIFYFLLQWKTPSVGDVTPTQSATTTVQIAGDASGATTDASNISSSAISAPPGLPSTGFPPRSQHKI